MAIQQLYDCFLGKSPCLQFLILALLILTICGCAQKNKLSKKWISDQSYWRQPLGVILKSRYCLIGALAVYIILFLLNTDFKHLNWPVSLPPSDILFKVLVIIICVIVFSVTAYVVANLNNLYSLRRQETRITVSQIILLSVFGLCLTITICALGIQKDSTASIIVSIFGAILGWVFQNTIKSVVAFFYLRANHLLQIGDWIEVKQHNIDGMVRRISLTTVMIENWDTTTTCFPTYILHAECFTNNQKMLAGRTQGRQMLKTFIIDTGWIHALSESDVERLHNGLNIDAPFKERYIKSGMLNIEVFRHYIYHWLMQCSQVSHEPRLIVRWLEQTNEGMPLQIYAFITDTALEPFEWQQSQIMEHVVKAMTWFDLQLYQSPSGYDASNSNIYLSPREADYKIKKENYVPLSK